MNKPQFPDSIMGNISAPVAKPVDLAVAKPIDLTVVKRLEGMCTTYRTANNFAVALCCIRYCNHLLGGHSAHNQRLEINQRVERELANLVGATSASLHGTCLDLVHEHVQNCRFGTAAAQQTADIEIALQLIDVYRHNGGQVDCTDLRNQLELFAEMGNDIVAMEEVDKGIRAPADNIEDNVAQ